MTPFAYLRDPLFLTACAAYFVNSLWLRHTFPSWFLHSYFNDLLLIPAALPPVLWLERRLGLRTYDCGPTWPEVFGHVVVWSVICEIVGPFWLHCGRADVGDVLAYVLGGVAAGFWWAHRGRKGALRTHEF